MEIREGLTFDDVLLVPNYSEIASRSDVDLSVKLPKGFELANPIIPANMKTVTGGDMALEMYKMGGMAILHRFEPLTEQMNHFKRLQSIYGPNAGVSHQVGFSVGVKHEDRKAVSSWGDAGALICCIDIAHGDSKGAVEMCEWIATKYPEMLLIAGNVATGSGARRLWEAGVDVVKVGVGPGSLCTTRIETGNGVPQLTALIEVQEAQRQLLALEQTKYYPHEKHLRRTFPFIADGGVKNAGDCVKALCFADMVMAGNLFAGSVETPGHTILKDGFAYKEYVGSSTHKANHIEGVSALVPHKGHAKDIVTKLLEGIRSGCSYQGAENLKELKEECHFVRITNAGLRESHPHDVIIK